MKNIHILPTDKPSRLKQNNITKKISLVNKGIDLTTYTPINIYITSPNEDINENDFIITKDGRLVQVSYLLSKDIYSASKVTLATDVDLIKDGVQAIDNEFIEWFVKNPSCEEVKVVYEPKNFLDTRQGWEYTIISKIPKEDWLLNNPHCKQIESCSKSLSKKCICPKEEPKQETQGYICPQTKKQCDDECCVSAEDCHIEASFDIISDCEPSKQETLEEFIQRQLSLGKYQDQESAIKYSIELGAKWQQERTCKHIYTLTSEQGHRVIKCSKCNDTQPI